MTQVELSKDRTVEADLSGYAADLLMSGGMKYDIVFGVTEVPSTLRVDGTVGTTLLQKVHILPDPDVPVPRSPEEQTS